jgi:hypothetical protein
MRLADEEPASKQSHRLASYIRTAKIAWSEGVRETGGDLDYPRVVLRAQDRLSSEFQKVAMRSVFPFRFGCTDYTVDFTIRREWSSVMEMNSRSTKPSVTYGVKVSCDHWRDGCLWGNDLEHLFHDHGQANVYGRIRAFLETMCAICDALETASGD